MDSDVVQLSGLLDVFEMRLRRRESKLVFVHVGDVPQDVLAAALGYHLSGKGERLRKREGERRQDFLPLKLHGHVAADWQHKLPVRIMRLPAAG